MPGPGNALHVFRLLPTVPEALSSLLGTVVVALFLLTFVIQPYLIPSPSMEHTLLVGDFLLVNKQVFSQPGMVGRWLLPYRDVARGDIVVFHHPQHPYVVKRVVGVPGDRLRVDDGRVTVNGLPLDEPYAAFDPTARDLDCDSFPGTVCTDPQVDPEWWRQMQSLTRDGEFRVPDNRYFVMGDNRNHSLDSRYWGFVGRQEIVARPLVIYFSLSVPISKETAQPTLEAADDRLGHDRELSSRITGFARWKRIFRVVH
jgi:signal peptidase I